MDCIVLCNVLLWCAALDGLGAFQSELIMQLNTVTNCSNFTNRKSVYAFQVTFALFPGNENFQLKLFQYK